MTSPDPLDALAAEGRARQAHLARSAQAAGKLAATATLQSPLVSKALAGDLPGVTAAGAFLPLMLLGLAVALIPNAEVGSTLVYASLATAFVCASLAALAAFLLTRRALVGAQLRWLQGLPFALDVGGYLVALSKEYRLEVLMTVRAAFTASVGESERATLAQAAVGALPGSAAVWEGDTLVIRSPFIKTWTGTSQSSRTSYRALHLWFRRCVTGALLVIQTRHPIASISLSIK